MNSPRTILGINAYHGDAAAALLLDGRVAAAVAEERFSRQKHEGGMPARAIAWCLSRADGPIDAIAVGRNPAAHAARKAFALARHPRLLLHTRDRLGNRRAIRTLPDAVCTSVGRRVPVTFVEHHRAHLTHAALTAPWESCAVLSLDSFGDFVSGAWGRGGPHGVEILGRVHFPHSLGLLYTALSQFLGFDRYGEEHKVMALAAFGTPSYDREIRALISLTPRGYALHSAYFEHTRCGVPMTFGPGSPVLGRASRPAIQTLLGKSRTRGEPLTERHADIAASLQRATEDAVLHMARLVRAETKMRHLAFSGGVALNSVANGALVQSGIFDAVWVPSAPGDDGTAIGAAATLLAEHGALPHIEQNRTPFLGPEDVPEGPREADGSFSDDVLRRVVEDLAAGAVVGWFDGRMEFGPRALGHRSILADPRRAEMKQRLNTVVKKREPFRPFAPMALAEDAARYFDLQQPSPNMMIVAPVRAPWRARLPAITHADGTARVQTVTRETDPRIARLLTLWKERTGMSVLLNTSFNEQEPIVCSSEQALTTARRAGIDVLVLHGQRIVLHERKTGERVAVGARHEDGGR